MTISSSASLAALPNLPRDNCSRVDFVKGAANQLKMQLSARSKEGTGSSANADSRVAAKLATLDTAIKSGDSRKAEAALAEAQSALTNDESSPSQDQAADHKDLAQSDAPPRKPLFQAWA